MTEKAKLRMNAHWSMLLCCLIATMIWGWVAHGYQFSNFQLTHDSLDGLYAVGVENAHKLELGRIFVPTYRYLTHGQFAMPWLIGLLTLLWIGLSAFLVVDMLGVRAKWQAIVISGVMTVNLTVTAVTGTYLHDLDADLFAMLMACVAAALWKKGGWWRLTLGAVAVAVSLGLYQSYVSVSIALVMIVLIIEILDGKTVKEALMAGLRGALMVIAGALLYMVCLYAMTSLSGVAIVEGRSNSVSAIRGLTLSQLPTLVCSLYRNWWAYFISPKASWLSPGVLCVANVLLMGVIVIATVRVAIRNALSAGRSAFIGLLALTLPIGMNLSYILTCGVVHDLMQYAFVLLYVLALAVVDRLWQNEKTCYAKCTSAVRWVSGGLLCVLLWANVQTANQLYFKKTIVTQATQAHMTNISHEMLWYGYIPGETTVLVSGALQLNDFPGFDATDRIIGAGHDSAITSDPKTIRSYFEYVLGDSVRFCTEEQRQQILSTDEFETMPAYPEAGYISFIEDVMVVRLR